MFTFRDPGRLVDGELELRLVACVERDEARQRAAAYVFEMRVGDQAAGGIRFRAENSFDVVNWAGHFGYNVEPAFRGQRFARRACRLLLPLARAHGLTEVWITCNPENQASRRTCERLGATLVEIVDLPESSDMYRDGERRKCRYRLDLTSVTL